MRRLVFRSANCRSFVLLAALACRMSMCGWHWTGGSTSQWRPGSQLFATASLFWRVRLSTVRSMLETLLPCLSLTHWHAPSPDICFVQVGERALRILSPAELGLMLGGSADLDVEEWRKHTTYEGGYTAESPQVCAASSSTARTGACHVRWRGSSASASIP